MRPERKTIPIAGQQWMIQVTDDASRTLIHTEAQTAYHSASGAAAETRVVYLENSGVKQRLSSGQPTSVLEIGLGTGMGMLMTLDWAIAAGTALDYTAVEHAWLGADVLRQLNLEKHLRDPSIAARFLDWRDSLADAVQHGTYAWRAGAEQTIVIEHVDALTWMEGTPGVYDAIYFDPFSPNENPELWQPKFLERLYSVLREEGRLVTYCVSRKVRDDFTAVGFDVSRVPGPKGGKREVMVATKGGAACHDTLQSL